MEHTYHIYISSNACGLHSLVEDFEYKGTKTNVVKVAREEKKRLRELGICKLPMTYDIYDFNLETYL